MSCGKAPIAPDLFIKSVSNLGEPQSKTSACTRIVEAEQLQDDEPSKSTFFNSSSQLLRNVLISLFPDLSIQDRVEKSRADAWFFYKCPKGFLP